VYCAGSKKANYPGFSQKLPVKTCLVVAGINTFVIQGLAIVSRRRVAKAILIHFKAMTPAEWVAATFDFFELFCIQFFHVFVF
jgi:hypothetical protein